MPLFLPPQILSNNSMEIMKDNVVITDSNVKFIIHNTTSTASTTKSVDISSYGLTSLYGVWAITLKSGTNITNVPLIHLISQTITQIQYQLVGSNSSLALSEGLEYDTSTNVNVSFLIIGK